MTKNICNFIALLVFSFQAQAQDASVSSWKNESEVAIVTTSGNSETEAYSGKEKLSYSFDANVLTAAGSYLQTKSAGIETAKRWDASLRYERNLTEQWTAFAQVGAESNPYAQYTQRDNADVGGKYYFIKKEKNELFAELGARSSRTMSTTGTTSTESFGRAYVEYSAPLSPAVSAKFWVEYLANFTNSSGYRINAEPSASVVMSEIFSLKVAYLTKYDNAQVAPVKKTDTSTTVSLVAKF